MDLLADLLRVAGVTGSIGTRIEASGAAGSWGVRLDRYPGAAVHAVTEGSAWLTTSSRPPRRLESGDVVLLPPGTVHELTSRPWASAASCDRAAAARAREVGDVVRLGIGPVDTRIVTVHYLQDPGARTRVLTALPDVVHVGAGAGAGHLQDTVRILGRELTEPGMASSVLLDRMIDVLLVQSLRAWAAAQTATQPGSWLAGLGDPVVSAALTLIHQAPERAWTAENLATGIAVSRATLARRFTAALDMSPTAYLLRWRMDLAAARLRDTDEPQQSIARAVGYASVHAFSRAFSRAHDEAPGRFRDRHRRTGVVAGDLGDAC
ncbi:MULTISPECIES: AraC family transcriptional regulator [unclassified Modestobacter]|uniref:AraC family transcriptional regulator n=1 Tax=unclassified Modestobacter TaxID=2643866 RepID=UPI0022AA45F4|nr:MULTISPECIES: AraC family transcriptional regulator [unclassified Modestobacter]MCZ2811926.1 AraC family transcriptional regulator [Modestobacter sp. VKM Ac-2979]MCZ2843649.1 AraC family transcriptional regulator [Modestobacter sp. VKM Ac-2980]MCZ2850848.1 AraC family transcriptional regulator [Modestobacter sp. VKM Ac-2978]